MRLCGKHNMTWGMEDISGNDEFYFDKKTKRLGGHIFEILKTRLFLRSRNEYEI